MIKSTTHLIAAVSLIVAVAACSDTTGGKNVTHQVVLSSPLAAESYAAQNGWSVKVDRGWIGIDSIRIYDGDAAFASGSPAKGFFSIKRAYAHPGHYVPGTLRGEYVTPISVDLLQQSSPLGTANGISGTVRSAVFRFSSVAAPFTSELSGNAMVIEGTATRDPERKTFRVEIAPDELTSSDATPTIAGSTLDAVDVQADGVITMVLVPGVWFSQMDFTMLESAAAGGAPRVLTKSEPQRNAFVRGIKSSTGYHFRYVAK